MATYSTIFFFKKQFWNAKSDPKFGQRKVVLVIPMPGNKVLECCSGSNPSEKELPEWCSSTFKKF
jgi:hypothetical protein